MDSRVFLAAAIFLAAYCLKKRKQSRIKKKPRRFWIRKIYERRHQYGNRLLGDLVYDQTVHNFTRMSVPADFCLNILDLWGPKAHCTCCTVVLSEWTPPECP